MLSSYPFPQSVSLNFSCRLSIESVLRSLTSKSGLGMLLNIWSLLLPWRRNQATGKKLLTFIEGPLSCTMNVGGRNLHLTRLEKVHGMSPTHLVAFIFNAIALSLCARFSAQNYKSTTNSLNISAFIPFILFPIQCKKVGGGYCKLPITSLQPKNCPKVQGSMAQSVLCYIKYNLVLSDYRFRESPILGNPLFRSGKRED